MNTTAAALQANVTPATIRTWCRRGAVAAAKVAGRWVIEAASLARRIAIGAPRVARPVVLNADTMIAIGGSRWTKNGMDRVYLNDWTRFIGLEINHYNTGNISSAFLDGERVSNSEAGRLASAVDKVYYDIVTGKLMIKWGFGNPRSMDRNDLLAAIDAGVRAEIAAL